MSYIPDYRDDIDKLDSEDQEYIRVYQLAAEDAKGAFLDIIDDIAEADFKEMTDEEKAEFIEDIKERFETLIDCGETDVMCSLAEQEKYEAVEFTDANKPYLEKMFKGVKKARQKKA